MPTIIDLSHPLTTTGGSYCADHPTYNCKTVCTIAAGGSNVSHLTLGSHTGTHIDAPAHFFDGGATVSDLDLSLLVCRAVVIDARGKGPREVISWDDISGYAERFKAGVMVLICTGWSRYWGREEYPANPRLDVGAAREIADRGVRVIGFDSLSPDGIPPAGEEETHEVHRHFLGRGGAIVENLNGLEHLLDSDSVTVSVLPLRLEGCDGSPVRAVAWYEVSAQCIC
ncbi:putative cyclase [Artomyces pyxidatus]|uniref:Cyclase n=1 Tax=Artomyces pyxidatus TaxID=48021 RepID=A0ACB8SWM6_9AGAM|nr:putative cyclase [Artomyces pyxidatus]